MPHRVPPLGMTQFLLRYWITRHYYITYCNALTDVPEADLLNQKDVFHKEKDYL